MPLARSDRDTSLDALTVDLLRSMFRNLIQWRSLCERTISQGRGLDPSVITCDGHSWDIQDIERLYALSQDPRVLFPRQSQAIRFFLVENRKESDVAALMGIKPTNPIGMYATDGLSRLIEMIRTNTLPV